MPNSNLIPNFNCFTHIMDYIPRTWNYMAGLQEFKTKHRELTELGKQLETQKNTVNSKVKDAEKEELVCNHDVIGWLQDVEAREIGLNEVLDEGSQLLQRSCLGACSPCGCWNSENFLIKVTSEISLVKDLIGKGNFITVSHSPPLAIVQLIPEDPCVGLKSVFEAAWSSIQEDNVDIMGLYGIGGVGKTTLLKKMNSEFSKRSCGFDVIIWVVISNDINIEGVRKQIRERLGLSSPVSENLSLPPIDIVHNLARKRFVILLDDVWKELDLASIGIPNPKGPNSAHKSKIVFTTRSSQVCGLMAADKNIRVECLNKHQAMELFNNRLGENSQRLRDPEIQKLSESIVKECAGLPLALIVTAGTMASKTTVGEWRYALTTLQKNSSEFTGMEEKVFSVLKFSYDNLPNKAIKSCLLFCSLYPEDDEIEVDNLIQQWIGEGHIDGFEEWESAVDKGYYIIGVLTSTCLLEFSVKKYGRNIVKMHDVIRDMAHWIARECGAENDKFLVKIGEQVTQAPDTEKWEKAHTVSMMNTGITHLYHIPKCSNLSTFLFIDNHSLPDNFFLYMPTLQFLDLSIPNNSPVQSHAIPTSIGELASLEYLNISSTVSQLPVEMKKLVALKYMFLRGYINVPLGVIKCLVNLRALGLNNCRFGDGGDDDRLAGMEELECLPELKHLQIEIAYSKARLLQDFLSRDRLVSSTWSLGIENLYSLPCLNLGSMEKIRKLRIVLCREIKELVIDNKASFIKLEYLYLHHLPQLMVSWVRSNCVAPFFNNLRYAEITECHRLVNLTWLSTAPVIQYLIVEDCERLEGILIEEGSFAFDENTFSQLRHLGLSCLPSLQSICSNALPFSFLEMIHVDKCPLLKKLPLDSTKAKKTLGIKGSSKWWNNLEWESESAESTFTSAFHAIG